MRPTAPPPPLCSFLVERTSPSGCPGCAARCGRPRAAGRRRAPATTTPPTAPPPPALAARARRHSRRRRVKRPAATTSRGPMASSGPCCSTP
eukprot:852804-Prymnesium_polylepis.1